MKKLIYLFFCGASALSYPGANAQTITTVAGNGLFGYSGDGGPAIAAKFKYPTSVAADASGNLYIGDGDSANCVRKVNAAGIITTFAGTGAAGYSGDGGPATAAMLYLNHYADAAGGLQLIIRVMYLSLTPGIRLCEK
jgi:hypothetical protein